MAATSNRRKPIHLVRGEGAISGRDAIWIAIRALRTFTASDLEDHVMRQPHKVRTNIETIKTYVTGLENAGYLQRIEKRQRRDDISGRYAAMQWQLVRDTGIDTPRVTKGGKEVTQGLAQEQMWRTMRILGDFDFNDLAIAASTEQVPVKPEAAKDYIKHLLRAGYLLCKQVGKPHHPGRYMLLPSKNTGAKAPMIQRIKQVFDPNLNRVVWPKGANDE